MTGKAADDVDDGAASADAGASEDPRAGEATDDARGWPLVVVSDASLAGATRASLEGQDDLGDGDVAKLVPGSLTGVPP